MNDPVSVGTPHSSPRHTDHTAYASSKPNWIGKISSFDFYFSVHESISSLIPICGVVCCVGGEGGNSNIATKTWKCFFLFFFFVFLRSFFLQLRRGWCIHQYICIFSFYSCCGRDSSRSSFRQWMVRSFARSFVCLFINCRFTHWWSVCCLVFQSIAFFVLLFPRVCLCTNYKCVFELGYSDRQVLLTFSAVWEQTYVAFYYYLFALAPPTQL